MKPPFRLPLQSLPELFQVGINTHGHLPVETYFHPDHWGFHLYHYAGVVEFEGVRHPFGPGFASITPPNTVLKWHFPRRATHYYALFRYPGEPGPLIELPTVLDLGEAFPDFCRRADEAMGLFPVNPSHSAVLIADLLWRHAAKPERSRVPAVNHPKLRSALVHLENQIHRPIAVGRLAAFLGISVTHLERLFRQAFGTTIRTYLRRRRTAKARHLLAQSSLPIAAIAQWVGIPDLHQFNKAMRRECGASPRRIRETASRQPTETSGEKSP